MKLSKLFHTLYATVMALPVIIIPIFAININQKSVEPISIEVQEKVSVDFNQKVKNGNFVNFDNWVSNNPSNQYSVENNILTCTFTQNYRFIYQNITSVIGDKYYCSGYFQVDSGELVNYFGSYRFTITSSEFTHKDYIEQASSTSLQLDVLRRGTYTSDITGSCKDIFVINLTQMYGVGNEPTIEQCRTLFNNNYYEYTESQKMLVNKPSPTTYEDTDIGSQFLYSLYKPVNDYFNFGEFFGLNGMYDWFQLNIFNGTAPLSFFIVFNVMIYWLFISLFWLLFDILIYVPMVIHKWLDKAEM